MVSTTKLIKVGVKFTDSYFETLKNIYNNAYRNNDSLEGFLNETNDYSVSNPLEAGGFKDTLTNLIVASTNDIRFSRPAQKALMDTIIRNTTGELIVNVGDDIKSGVRDIISRGYREGKLNHKRVADEISTELDGINRKRARTISRTEIKRAQTTSNYVVARERGANAYEYECGANPCDICREDCGKTFPIDDMEHLPPRHPNCMCGVRFFKDPDLPDVESTSEEDENNTPITTPSNAVNESVNKRTPMDEDIADVKEYISELKEEMKNTTNKYDLRDLETELKEAQRELKSYQLEKENFLKQQNSSVEKIQPTTVKFTNDSNIKATPNEVRAVYGHKTNHLPESVRENMNQFSKATKSKRNEFSQCYTSSGKISDLMEGTSKKVSETPKITQWKQTVVKHGEEVHLTHNHPVRSDFKLTILSPGDIQSFRSSGFTSYTAEYGGEARVTIGKLPGFKEGKKSEKALSDMIQLTIDIEKGMHLKKYDFSTEKGFERFTNDMNNIAENGGYYYRIEKLNLKNESSSFPKSNMKDERTDFERANDRLHELSTQLSIETDPKKFAKLKQEYDELVLRV